jgi:hypothetical protein
VTDALSSSSDVEQVLERRLALWAATRRMSDAQLLAVRASVLSMDPLRDAAHGFDTDRLWSLLRPVTDLIDRAADVTESGLPRRVGKWLEPFVGDAQYQPYLRLA